MANLPRTTVPNIFSFEELPKSLVIGRSLFFGISLLFLITSVICTWNALKWVDKPFAGFLVNERMVVSYLGPTHWTGVQAGLKFPDKVLKANGRSLISTRDLEKVIASVPVGGTISYSVQKGEQLIEVTIPTMRFSWMDFWVTFGTGLLTGLLYAFIGVVVFALKPDTTVSWSFLLSCMFLSISNVTAFDLVSTHVGLIRLYFFATTFCPAVVLHLSLVFPEKSKLLKYYPNAKVTPYLLSTLLVIPLELFYPEPKFLTVYSWVLFYTVASATALLGSIVYASVKSASVLARTRAKVILFGAALAFPIPAAAPIVSFWGGSLAGVPIDIAELPLLIFPASIAYAIVKHNLFDVDQYIKRTVGYVIMTAIVATGYFALETVVKTAILDPLLGSSAEKAYPIVFALLTVFAFNPVSLRVQAVVDKLFYRAQYDYKAAVTKVSDAITSIFDLNELVRQVIETVRKELFVDQAGVVLLDDRKKACQAVFIGDEAVTAEAAQQMKRELCIAYDDPLLALLAKEKKLVTIYDIEEDPLYASVREPCGRRFSELGATLALPLYAHDEFTGILAIGHKKSGHFYTREDIELLKTVSGMTSTAIEQAREKGQKEIMRKLFEKHVSPEVAEAVWQQRELFLEGGRPRSQKLTVTVLFTDLKGFSTVSEKMDPQALMDWLNGYMDKMTKIVMDHGGIVDDYFGDAIKVNFGVPLPRKTEAEIRQDAFNAVNCALAMDEEMVRLNRVMMEQGLPMLRMRVGIYTGPVVAGSLGSADRLKYTTIGDTVNTASRLESFDKDLTLPHLETSPCRILIGETTLRYLDEQFATQKVGELSLKGKDEKITAYCVLGRADQYSPGVLSDQKSPMRQA